MTRRSFIRNLLLIGVAIFVVGRLPRKESKEEILKRVLSTPEGRRRLAMARVSPIRRYMDYQGCFRKAFSVVPIPIQ